MILSIEWDIDDSSWYNLSLYSINNTAAPKSVEILAKKLTKNAKFMRSPINYMHFLQILV